MGVFHMEVAPSLGAEQAVFLNLRFLMTLLSIYCLSMVFLFVPPCFLKIVPEVVGRTTEEIVEELQIVLRKLRGEKNEEYVFITHFYLPYNDIPLLSSSHNKHLVR